MGGGKRNNFLKIFSLVHVCSTHSHVREWLYVHKTAWFFSFFKIPFPFLFISSPLNPFPHFHSCRYYLMCMIFIEVIRLLYMVIFILLIFPFPLISIMFSWTSFYLQRIYSFVAFYPSFRMLIICILLHSNEVLYNI